MKHFKPKRNIMLKKLCTFLILITSLDIQPETKKRPELAAILLPAEHRTDIQDHTLVPITDRTAAEEAALLLPRTDTQTTRDDAREIAAELYNQARSVIPEDPTRRFARQCCCAAICTGTIAFLVGFYTISRYLLNTDLIKDITH